MALWNEWSGLQRLLALKAAGIIGGGASWVWDTVSGTAPLSLPSAIAKAIKSLVQYGKTVQSATPTPSAPVDIVINNGTLTMVDDELPSGYVRLQSIESDGTDGYVATGIVIDSVDIDVEVDFQYLNTSASQPKMLWGYMDGVSNLPRWGFGIYSTGWLGSPNATASRGPTDSDRHTAIMSVYERSGASYYSGTVDETELYGETALGNVSVFEGNVLPLILFARNNKGTEGNFANAKIFRFKVTKANVLTHDLVPCKDDLGVIGFYDLVTETFLTASGTLTAGAVDYSHASIKAVGNPEVLSVGSANLFDASAVADENKYINSNTGATASPGSGEFRYSDYIPVTEGVTYFFGITAFTASAAGVAWYSATQERISGRSGTWLGNNGMKDTAPVGAKFARFSIRVDEGYDTNWQNTVYFCKDGDLTQYEPYRAQTASVVNLLSVGTYADTQDIISGHVDRAIGVYVFDGTETWIDGNNGYITEVVQDQDGGTYAPVCSHFRGVSTAPAKNSDTVRVYRTSGGTGRMYFAPNMTTYATKEDFAAWLASQYAAGTPVIIIYPLDSPTTESVTAQHLATAQGDNSVSVVSNVDPVTLEVEYAKAVST